MSLRALRVYACRELCRTVVNCLLFSLAFSAQSKILFHSDFERGETYLAKALKPGVKTIELVPNFRLEEWPVDGGEGIVEGNLPSRAELFQYRRREGVKLKGVSGIEKHHVKWAGIQTGNLSEWETYAPDAGIKSPLPPFLDRKDVLYGSHSARFDGIEKRNSQLIKEFSFPNSGRLHTRFYVRFAGNVLGTHEEREFPFSFAGTPKSSTPRVCVFKQRSSRDVRFGFSRLEEGAWRVLRRKETGYANTRVEPGRTYCLESGLHLIDSAMARMQLWIDGNLCEEIALQLVPLPARETGPCLHISKQKNQLKGARYWVDEVILADSLVGPLPSKPLVNIADGALSLQADEGPLKGWLAHWQISQWNAWVAPEYSRIPGGSLHVHLSFPYVVSLPDHRECRWLFAKPANLPTGLREGKRYLARARYENSHGNRGEWSEPIRLVVPPKDESLPSITPGLPKIEGIHFTWPGKQAALNGLQKGAWHDVHVRFSGQKKDDFARQSYLDLYFCGASEEAIADYCGRGGFFSPRDNYTISLDMNAGAIYAKEHALPSKFILRRKVRGLYCDATPGAFTYDLQEGTVRFRFRLLDSAVSGPWVVRGFVCNRHGLVSPMVRKLFYVSKDPPGRETSRTLAITLGTVVVVFVIAGMYFWQRSRRRLKETDGPDKVRLEIAPEHRERIEAARDFVQENFRKPISSKDIAAGIGVTPGWLSTLFHQGTGKTVVQYLNECRISEAKKLLLETQKSISEIAFMVGFKSLFGFRNAFRGDTGVSPANFRKKHQA